ncbi:MAG: DUF3795 domain-containing protein [Fusicatenibacter sp.]|nr:DUF3795 domain-containing protein [Fusicatenibacter sp.]
MTRKDFASHIGIPLRTVEDWEAGRRRPPEYIPRLIEYQLKYEELIEQGEKIIAACGNDCSACPRYHKEPYKKTDDELRHTAEIWFQIGYRDHIVRNEEIACTGCKEDNWCRYRIVKCVNEKQIDHCGQCNQYPCDHIEECFEVTKLFEPSCKKVCTREEYRIMKKAFFEKRQNLDRYANREL